MKRLHQLMICIVAATLAACSATPTSLSQPDLPAPAYWPTGGWQSSTPAGQDMDPGLLAEMLEAVQADATNLHSLLVIRNGYIVLEAYADPYGPDVRHTVESNTKSVTGTLVGLAIAQGQIEDDQQRMVDFFPERMIQNMSKQKQEIKLSHLLSMTSGLDCADMTPPAQAMYADRNWTGYLLDLPVISAPGKKWAYCSGSVHLLSAILQTATGSTAREYANQHLFEPLGIEPVSEQDWMPDPKGVSNGIAGLYLAPRELAKYGFLYLHRGQWDGQQIIPAEWVDASTTSRFDLGKDDFAGGLHRQWGYLFSIFPDQGFYGYLGMAGQNLFVAPEENLVVVFNSGLKVGEEGTLLKLMTDYILPAARTGRAGGSAESEVRLQLALERFAGLAQPIQPVPAGAQAANGVLYRFETNPLGWSSLAMQFTGGADTAILSLDDTITLQAGLDGRYRLNDVPNSRPAGLRGRWDASGALVLDYMVLGQFAEQVVTIQFNGSEVKLVIQDKNYGGDPLELAGSAR